MKSLKSFASTVEFYKYGTEEAEKVLHCKGGRPRDAWTREPIDGDFARCKTPAKSEGFSYCELKNVFGGWSFDSGFYSRPFGYDSIPRLVFDGKPDGNNSRYGIEIEHMYKVFDNFENSRAYVLLYILFRAQCEHDCTVNGEIHIPDRRNLSGLREIMAACETFFDLSAYECGTHIHYSADGVSGARCARNVSAINTLLETMKNNRTSTIELFGRNFNEYASGCRYPQPDRYAWLNCLNESNVEWRLCHYTDINQFLTCADMVKHLSEALCGQGKKTAVEVFKYYAEGKAPIQKRGTIEKR